MPKLLVTHFFCKGENYRTTIQQIYDYNLAYVTYECQVHDALTA